MARPMPKTEPETDPLLAAVGGDRDAVDALARAWWPRMRRWALLELGDVSLAEDASQEALVKMMRALPSFDADRPFAPWLRAVVRNAARDVARKRGVVLPFEADPSAPSRIERAHDLRRASDAVLGALGVLTPRQRELIDRCDRGHQTAAEAARELGIEPGTARALLYQGRRALRGALLADHPDYRDLFVETP